MGSRDPGPMPVLRLGVMPTVPMAWVRAAITDVRRRQPRLVVLATAVWAEEATLRRLLDGDLDVAVVIGPVAATGLLVEQVAVLGTRAYVGPDHPLSQRSVIDRDELLEEPTFRRPDGVSDPWRRHWLLLEHRGGDEPRFLDVSATTEWEAVLAVGSTRAVGFAPAGWAAGVGLHPLIVRDAPGAPVLVLCAAQQPRPGWADHFRTAMQVQGARSAGLTPAESRVAELVAQGLTNREIGTALCVSTRTVDTQLASALRRLSLRNRTELAASWHEHGGIVPL